MKRRRRSARSCLRLGCIQAARRFRRDMLIPSAEVREDEPNGDTVPFEEEHAVWARLKKDILGARCYQLGLLFTSEFWYTASKDTMRSPFSPQTTPLLVLKRCVLHRAAGKTSELREAAEFPVVPTQDELRDWEEVDRAANCSVVCGTDIPRICAGSRVTISAYFKDGHAQERRSGIVTDIQPDGLCRVRVQSMRKPLDVLGRNLISDLVATPTRGDEVVLDADDVRPHFLSGNVLPAVGDRVIVLDGPQYQRVGTVDYQQSLKSGTMVGVRSGDVTVNNIAAAHVAQLFLPGDSVKIVYGHFAGETGYVTRTFSLNWKKPKRPQVPPGGVQIQICKEGETAVVETICQWVRFSHTPATNEAQKEGDHWLSRWDFSGKRLDVKIGPSRRGRPSKVHQSHEGLDGFIEPKERVVVGENGFIDVVVEQTAKRVRLQAQWLQPIHNPKPPRVRLPDQHKSDKMLRVVVIGGDMNGSLQFMGKYGFVNKDEAEKSHVVVTVVSEDGAKLGEASYAIESICRSTNTEGYNTRPTKY
uniref:KOW domain-containing protein n=1 Tax=Mycena chlorophos TaxID=658473 RepID=A0ABQ0LMT6_MYCCL|nr:predicted protein [Mycena chlorophos]